MSATEIELTLPAAMANSQYDADGSCSDLSSSPALSDPAPDRRSSVTLEDASKALINASHSLTNAAHEYTLAIQQSTQANDEVSELLQLKQGDLRHYNFGLQELANHVAYISAYMQKQLNATQANEDGAGTDIQKLNDKVEQVTVAKAKNCKEGYVEGSSDTSEPNSRARTDESSDESIHFDGCERMRI
ncbi:hypothetical protein PMZ80_002991 [Knufia obscura]|uniref:Uncharacterized protein n=2 Tax=Knufia TaxID=430999 RepID=A0AAN8ECM1_9EURO|nr:hypothetical protein PMZ80_002991 [Knufia obscura]KAK5952424.1 hypothetical protein OHC33_006467 [Knufia fluminis]